MHVHRFRIVPVVTVLAVASLAACGGSMLSGASDRAHPAFAPVSASGSSGVSFAPVGSTSSGGYTASPAATEASGYASATTAPGAYGEPHPATRPGLATGWGERRYDAITFSSFQRASDAPWATTTIHYNDAEGAVAQAAYRADRFAPVMYTAGVSYGGSDGVHVALHDDDGAALPGQIVGDALYVIGHPGQHYAISLVNPTPLRLEAVISVDGLDVMDGHPADLAHRGYIVQPYGTLRIDGFRESTSTIAAFRFGSVADSYAAQTGSARNVGVVGVALFTEAGAVMPSAPPSGEVWLRETANPFPGGFAAPPPRRAYW